MMDGLPPGLACCLRCRDFVVAELDVRYGRLVCLLRNPTDGEAFRIRRAFPRGWSGFQQRPYMSRSNGQHRPCEAVVLPAAVFPEPTR